MAELGFFEGLVAKGAKWLLRDTLSESKQHMPETIRAYSKIDANKDGVVSSTEMALGFVSEIDGINSPKRDEAKKILKNELCRDGNQKAAQYLADVYSINTARNLQMLNNGKLPTDGGELVQNVLAGGLAIIPNLNKKNAQSFANMIGRLSGPAIAELDQNLITTHKAMVGDEQLGALPKVVTPMSAKDMCSELKTVKI
ncbi:MAG: hypothetical protein ACOYNL_01310 [Rickettsiales bacterium]